VAPVSPSPKDRVLKTKRNQGELSKSYTVYDDLYRVREVYSAPVQTEEGGECLCVRFAYRSSTSLVTKTRESKAQWQAAWDIGQGD
jgi:hypothetical protein